MELDSKINFYQTLPQWISCFDDCFISNLDLKERGHKYFKDTYKACDNLRKDFRINFLPKLESDLGFPSSNKFKYEYYFKSERYPEFELAEDYYYNEKINLLKKNYSTTNINNHIEKNKNFNDNKNENINYAYTKKNNENINDNINIKKEKKGQNIKNVNDKEMKKENNIYKKNVIIYKKGQDEIKKKPKNIEEKENYGNKKPNLKIGQNHDKDNIQKNIIKNNSKQNVNNSLIKNEKKVNNNKIDKKNNINKISQIYNKNIIPIKEESYEKDLDESDERKNKIKYNENKNSQKLVINHRDKNNLKKPNNIKNNTSNKIGINIPKNTETKNILINNNTFIKPFQEKTKLYEKKDINNKSKTEQNLLSSISKRNSIKNYLLLKKSKLFDNTKDDIVYEDNHKKELLDKINHSRIKNYLNQKIKNIENEKGEEKNITQIISRNNNTVASRKQIKESKSSYDLFKKNRFEK
jgi:hypothetical protein